MRWRDVPQCTAQCRLYGWGLLYLVERYCSAHSSTREHALTGQRSHVLAARFLIAVLFCASGGLSSNHPSSLLGSAPDLCFTDKMLQTQSIATDSQRGVECWETARAWGLSASHDIVQSQPTRKITYSQVKGRFRSCERFYFHAPRVLSKQWLRRRMTHRLHDALFCTQQKLRWTQNKGLEDDGVEGGTRGDALNSAWTVYPIYTGEKIRHGIHAWHLSYVHG